tara:strand:- start:2127 stop:3044 length:918 start_codon:yes stop_codon:yes gene_type:complete
MTNLLRLKKELSKKYKKNLNLLIPKNDVESYLLYPKYNFVYNKMFICKYQKIKHAPMPIVPKKFPVIIKPIINLLGMGNNAIKIDNIKEFSKYYDNNHFWCEYLKGKHLSWDFIIRNGEIQFMFCFRGYTSNFGCFDYWKSYKKHPKLPKIITNFIYEHLKEYTGFLNIETISNKIIEVHLRMGDIDHLPKEYIKLFYLNIIDFNINLKQKLDSLKFNENIFLFPIWQKININTDLDKIYEYLENEWESKIIEDNKITSYYFDKPKHTSPMNMKRWFLLCTKTYNYGLKIKQAIEQDILLKSGKM